MKTKTNTLSAAESRDILGPAQCGEAVPAAWRHYQARLTELRRHLIEDANELERSAQDESPSFSVHMADAATDSFDRDLALSLLGMEHNAVGEIDAALQRIRDKSYGICELTGKLIPRARLEAIPWARHTVEAQAELEKTGDAARVHLGQLESIEPEGSESQ